MDHEDCAGPRRDRGLDRVGRDVVGDRVDVREDGDGVLVDDGRGARDVGECGQDDLVPRLDADTRKRAVDRRCPAVDRDCVAIAGKDRELAFELVQLGAA